MLTDNTAIDISVYNEVAEEKGRQIKKWGIQSHDLTMWDCILSEEKGEVSKAILDKDLDGLKRELIQVATVALNIYDALCSKE